MGYGRRFVAAWMRADARLRRWGRALRTSRVMVVVAAMQLLAAALILLHDVTYPLPIDWAQVGAPVVTAVILGGLAVVFGRRERPAAGGPRDEDSGGDEARQQVRLTVPRSTHRRR